jgi:hypothetical protein
MNSEKTDSEPTLLLPDILDPQTLYEVVDVGPLVRSHTDKESGHFDVRIYVAPLLGSFSALSQQSVPRGPRTIIQVPSVLLPHATRGTLWQNCMNVGEILYPKRHLDLFIHDGCFVTLTGAEIFDRHFTEGGQRFAAAIEIAANPKLSDLASLFSESFLETSFVHILNGKTDYYVPCDVLFNACFYGSYLIASNILAGNFEEPRNKLYRPLNSGWNGTTYTLDARHCAPASDELAIARLVCRPRGLDAMRHIRASLQNQILNNGYAYIRAHFPFRGSCKLAVRGKKCPRLLVIAFLLTGLSAQPCQHCLIS